MLARSILSTLIVASLATSACRRGRDRQGGEPSPIVVAKSAAPIASAPSPPASSSVVAPEPARAPRSMTATVAAGNANPHGEPNVWIHVPAGYRSDRPLRVVFVFHGHENCIKSFVGPTGASCRPGAPARITYDLATQLDRLETSAITIAPQLAYDEKHGDPGVLVDGPAFERFAKEVIEVAAAPLLGARKLEEVERVAMIAISGGFVALYHVLSAFDDGVKIRDVYMLDAYYALDGALDAFVAKNLADYAVGAPRPRRLGLIYTVLESTRVPSQAFAARLSALTASLPKGTFAHRTDPQKEIAPEDLAAPISFVFTSREHDDLPKYEVGKLLAASGI